MTLDVVKLASAAGMTVYREVWQGTDGVRHPTDWMTTTPALARFAALVLEEAAKVCDERAKRYDERATASDAMDDYERRAECAEAARCLAAAIRAMKGE